MLCPSCSHDNFWHMDFAAVNYCEKCGAALADDGNEKSPDVVLAECPLCNGSGEMFVRMHDYGRWAVDPPEPIFDKCHECDGLGRVLIEAEPITLEDLERAHEHA